MPLLKVSDNLKQLPVLLTHSYASRTHPFLELARSLNGTPNPWSSQMEPLNRLVKADP